MAVKTVIDPLYCILQLFALGHVEMEDSVLLQMCVHVPVAGLEHNVNEVYIC